MKSQEKREKFIKLAESRTNIIIKTLGLLSNLSNKSAYSYNDSDIREIFSTIEKELKIAKSRFEDNSNGKKQFKLSNK